VLLRYQIFVKNAIFHIINTVWFAVSVTNINDIYESWHIIQNQIFVLKCSQVSYEKLADTRGAKTDYALCVRFLHSVPSTKTALSWTCKGIHSFVVQLIVNTKSSSRLCWFRNQYFCPKDLLVLLA
jgi:hypothetical protein